MVKFETEFDNITKDDVIKALNYIDENGVPEHNVSVKYFLVTEDGKKYPPKYVVAVAAHFANGLEISTAGFSPSKAINYLKNLGFKIETKNKFFELHIFADRIFSTDERFTMNNLHLGNNYKPIDAYFKNSNGEEIHRNYTQNERKISNQTLPRIACQIFENELDMLPIEDKENFPICRYNLESKIICGIYSNLNDFKSHYNTIEYVIYNYDNDKQFVFYCWNIFSTIIFVQECLKRFGKPDDNFILIYQDKSNNETEDSENVKEIIQNFNGYKNSFSAMLIKSKNIIFRGAPGTGKTYLAKKIAADIISNGKCHDYKNLNEDQKKQVEFVQFHPSYDYSDFVEGLRPKKNDDGTISFELKDGIFKKFVDRARENYENFQKTAETIEKEISVENAMTDFFENVKFVVEDFETISGNKFFITDVDDKKITIFIPDNATVNKLFLNIEEIKKMLESDKIFTKVKDVTDFFGKTFGTQAYSYYFAIYNEIRKRKISASAIQKKPKELKKYIFIIDEINRGEISKIFGELFFSIDPGYRGKSGEISTQYANLHTNENEKFYIPENVYIIGTMNDIDKSVESFDFAMRRRFRFVEIKADEHLEMLDSLENDAVKNEAVKRMRALNKEIASVEDLNENYQIGAAYFLKLKTLNFEQLWTDYLEPLLKEYVQGLFDEKNIMKRFATAYGYSNDEENINEPA